MGGKTGAWGDFHSVNCLASQDSLDSLGHPNERKKSGLLNNYEKGLFGSGSWTN